MERCGKINASNSGSESWTGIGVVAGFCTVVLIMQWPHRRNGEVTWRSELLQRLQEVRGNCKTRNQLNIFFTRPGLFPSGFFRLKRGNLPQEFILTERVMAVLAVHLRPLPQRAGAPV